MAGVDHFHHFACTFDDTIAALLLRRFFDSEASGETDAAVYMHAVIGGLEPHFVDEILTCKSFFPCVPPCSMSDTAL